MILAHIVLFSVGLVGLFFGADWVVRGAARLARTLGVSALVVGLTVVSLGTSAPELLVSVIASAQDQGQLAVGNVVGSNILNIALILGVAAVIYPLRVQVPVIAREIPVMILISVAAVVFAMDGSVGRLEGVLFLTGLSAYLLYVVRASRREPLASLAEFSDFERAVRDPRGVSRARNIALIVLGLAVLAVAAHLLVRSALFFAHALGVSEVVVGITIVAVGTSLPELATSIVAALRRETDIALGNAVGSNVFNLLAVLGAAALVRPLPVDPALLRFEFPVMLGASLVILPLALAGTRLRLGRWEGILLLLGYVVFTIVLFQRASLLSGIRLPV